MGSTVFEAAKQENQIEQQAFVDETTFKANWRAFSKGLLEGLDWSNVLVVGGSVLGSLNKTATYLQNSDIDIYLYNLSHEEALKRVTALSTCLVC